MSNDYSEAVETARGYYNSDDADNFYANIWGGQDIHIGLYDPPNEEIASASRKTVERMRGMLRGLGPSSKVLDLGAGYGGAARHLAKHSGSHVTCLNLSEVQNERNRALNKEESLEHLIDVIDGNFEDIPASFDEFDVIWSQDAFLHSGNRVQVLREIDRVLKPGGVLIFTDPMRSDDCPLTALQPILERLQLDTMGSPGFYRDAARKLGWAEETFVEMTNHLTNHYRRVREEIIGNEETELRDCSEEYLEKMKAGLQRWVDAGQAGHLSWGIFVFRTELV